MKLSSLRAIFIIMTVKCMYVCTCIFEDRPYTVSESTFPRTLFNINLQLDSLHVREPLNLRISSATA